MLVSHRKAFIYTKTEKTGGTSVEAFFEKYCLPGNEWREQHYREETVTPEGIIGYRGSPVPSGVRWYNHMPAVAIRDQLGSSTWERYFKFCVIRNPFEKMISGFLMLEDMFAHAEAEDSWRVYMRDMYPPESPVWKVQGSCQVDRFRSWVGAGGWVDDRDKYLINGQVCVDFFIRYEALNEGMREVCARIGETFTPASLPEYKVRRHKRQTNTAGFYDQATAELVASRYAWEIDTFNYTIPGA